MAHSIPFIDIERNYRLFKFCYVPATGAASSKGILAVATNSTIQTNKAGCLSVYLSYMSMIPCLSFAFFSKLWNFNYALLAIKFVMVGIHKTFLRKSYKKIDGRG
jgi:hypothetical protein